MYINNQYIEKIGHWKSVLFVPANEDRFLSSCVSKGANAIALDLEDSVLESEKNIARQNYKRNLNALREQGSDVCVRINRDLRACVADLEAVVVEGTDAIVVPKVISGDHLVLIDELISELEFERGLPLNSIALIAMVESARALQNASTWGQDCSRLAGLFFGTEDFCFDTGMQATADNLFYPAQQLVLAAKSMQLLSFGFPASIADYSDESVLRDAVEKGRSLGFDGVFCIHPKQVNVVNQSYQSTTLEIDKAAAIVSAFEHARELGKGAVEVGGKMVDAPVYNLARKVLLKFAEENPKFNY
ncbi:MAG: citrate lyase subunit beta/citryl-CoA lyase [Bermanella sp.]|jgi:citrate lyase subunit beta/citryl-CoA lyase